MTYQPSIHNALTSQNVTSGLTLLEKRAIRGASVYLVGSTRLVAKDGKTDVFLSLVNPRPRPIPRAAIARITTATTKTITVVRDLWDGAAR